MSTITIRSATPSDLPQMAALLIHAFSPGPWSRHLFPLHLRVGPGDADELDFRLHQLSSRFESSGWEHVCATIQHPGGEKGDVVVGWAQWFDSRGKMGRDGKEGEPGAPVAGLDREALARLTREGEVLEKRLAECLGKEGTNDSRREFLFSLHRTQVAPISPDSRLRAHDGLRCPQSSSAEPPSRRSFPPTQRDWTAPCPRGP